MSCSAFVASKNHKIILSSGTVRDDLSVEKLSSELTAVVADWWMLGSRLGLKQWQLKAFERDHPSSKERLDACLDAWLQSKTDASWNDVVAALKEMGDNALAMKLEERLCGEG